MQNFRALGAPPPDPVPPAAGAFPPSPQPPAAGGFAPRPPIGLRRLGAPPPDPPNSPSHWEFLATRLCQIFEKLRHGAKRPTSTFNLSKVFRPVKSYGRKNNHYWNKLRLGWQANRWNSINLENWMSYFQCNLLYENVAKSKQ